MDTFTATTGHYESNAFNITLNSSFRSEDVNT
ncbi:hypothetical protein SNOG_16405 [Parastagonospora nodorum SN15]|uniref:Uncharacterized protein n=1 Tax=Phaeosphaeria nodorum (strain SN15 / ATCC MYA-4574 / FGSC 10173) TaxID=321614 RepID=Q0TVS2_PHANO|nr:hypothetical protein SNOG_16405 [Parastagonospora nodorum SN15]EAT76230.1 hypothetical protein SNOG_16405 [Parastagonospora nodorum SN15]